MLAAELEAQPRVDRAEHGAPLQGALSQAVDVFEQPRDLRGREVGVEHQARALSYQRLAPLGAQALAQRRGAPVLPHDRAVQRLSAGGIPHAHGLALVGDPDRLELARAHARIGERLARDRPRHLPDLARVVLHPSRSGEVLGELAVCASDRLGALVEDEARRSGGALVDRQDHG